MQSDTIDTYGMVPTMGKMVTDGDAKIIRHLRGWKKLSMDNTRWDISVSLCQY